MAKKSSSPISTFFLTVIIMICLIGVILVGAMSYASYTGKTNPFLSALGIEVVEEDTGQTSYTDLTTITPTRVSPTHKYNSSPLDGIGESSDGFSLPSSSSSRQPDSSSDLSGVISLEPASRDGSIGQSGLTPGTPVSLIQRREGDKVYYKSCTVAFSLPGDKGFPWAVTAGHCGEVGDKVFSPPSEGGVPRDYIGTVRYVSESHYNKDTGDKQGDWALISLNTSAHHPPTTTTVPRAIELDTPSIGTRLCKYGATTKYECGKKSAEGVMATITGGFDTGRNFTAQQDAVTMCALPGDSGAPIFTSLGIVGILSSTNSAEGVKNTGSCEADDGSSEVYYVPVVEVLEEIDDFASDVDVPGI